MSGSATAPAAAAATAPAPAAFGLPAVVGLPAAGDDPRSAVLPVIPRARAFVSRQDAELPQAGTARQSDFISWQSFACPLA